LHAGGGKVWFRALGGPFGCWLTGGYYQAASVWRNRVGSHQGEMRTLYRGTASSVRVAAVSRPGQPEGDCR
jgi:hypothetical protein